MMSSKGIAIGRENEPLDSKSRAYVAENIKVTLDGSTGSLSARNYSASEVLSDSPNMVVISSTAVQANAGSFVEALLANAGSRPASRKQGDVDYRIVSEVATRSGAAINCVEDDGTERCALNGGGWPADSAVRITHSIPENPRADDDGDGYTNLEEWLHLKAANVEVGGVSKVTRPNPPTVLEAGE